MLSKKFSSATFLTILAVCNALPGFAQELNPHWNTGRGPDIQAPFLMADYSSNTPNERKVTEDTSGFLQWTDNGAGLSYSLGYGASPLGLSRGGTGGATQQAAINSLLGYSGLASQDIIYYDGSNWSIKHKGSNGQVLGIDGSGLLNYISPAGSGTVTSVGLTMPSWLTVGGSPVTGAGTLAVSNGTGLTANRVVGTDGSGNLDLMAMTADQVPSLNASKITAGNLAKARSATEGVYNDQSNTYAGAYTQDFSDASQNVKLPLRAVATSNGSVSVDSSDLAFYAGGAAHKAAKQATTISAGTGLSGGGDLSANRTISLSTPVSAANGGTGADLSGATTGAIVYKGASALTSLSPSGNGGKFIRFNSGATAPEAASIAGAFGGDASDGAVTKGAVTESAVIQVNATTFTQTVSTTWAPLSRTVVMASSTVDLNGTTTVGYGPNAAASHSAGYSAGGSGPSGGGEGGHHSSQSGGGGGGGGFGGAGGNGGEYSTSLTTGCGGVGGAVNDYSMTGPSAGGNGGWGFGPVAGGVGGKAGGSFLVEAVGALTVGGSATINIDGEAGSAGGTTYGGGGGGGSGGYGGFFSQTSVTVTSGCNINARGGAGGNGTASNGGRGAGGGGGKIVRMAPTISGAGTITVTGGTASSTGSGTATNGGAGVNLSVTDTPSRAIAQELMRGNIDLLYKWHTAFGNIKEGEELRLNSARPAAVWCAQFYPAEKREALVNEWLFGEDLSGGKTATIEKREDLNDAA